ncbi:MAG: helix-turn-helix domain-containing protein [Oscillospiraceae bacterium]|jgi:transposase-like protein|nr:helix-turn-helix domain-containing protein [Oscillospiraceae bacterium]
MAGRRVDDNKKRQIIKLYYSGKSVHEIAGEYNIPRSTIYRWIKSGAKDKHEYENGCISDVRQRTYDDSGPLKILRGTIPIAHFKN